MIFNHQGPRSVVCCQLRDEEFKPISNYTPGLNLIKTNVKIRSHSFFDNKQLTIDYQQLTTDNLHGTVTFHIKFSQTPVRDHQ